MSQSPHILVLAAGASTRLGRAKQTALVDGQPALQKVVTAAQAAADHVIVVLGSQAAEIAPLLRRSSASVLINREWSEGLASSIRFGVSSLGVGCEAALLLLGDQVAVSAADLRRLIAAWQPQADHVTAALYNGQPGVPAIFPRWCFSELLQLRGDVGANAILRGHGRRLVQVPMSSAAVDLDTPEDLAALNRSEERRRGPDESASDSGSEENSV